MARLKFDGEADEYFPAFGLTGLAGAEADYPDSHEAALLATGRFKHALLPRAPKAEKADSEKGKE